MPALSRIDAGTGYKTLGARVAEGTPVRGRRRAASPAADNEPTKHPSRPVRLIVGLPAGYATHIVARLIAQSLSERLGQQVAVENRTPVQAVRG